LPLRTDESESLPVALATVTGSRKTAWGKLNFSKAGIMSNPAVIKRASERAREREREFY
jgi:hypothetical protein